MHTYDLALAWNWEFDHDFIYGIEQECRKHGITTYRIDPTHLSSTLEDVKSGRIHFQSFFDRASDADTEFLPLVRWMVEHALYYINPYHRVMHAVDKATMHLESISNGLNVPDTVFLPPFNEQKDVSLCPADIDRLGKPFVIKPVNTTGGGTGVVMNARTLDDVLQSRQDHKNDKYLIQQVIVPDDLDGNRAWFRVYYAFGDIVLCWWDDQTHMYSELSRAHERRYGLEQLRDVMRTIQSICQLDFFSSEIAYTSQKKFVVVDYVNEVCDMRLQSKFANGSPDAVVHHIEWLLANEVAKRLQKAGQPD